MIALTEMEAAQGMTELRWWWSFIPLAVHSMDVLCTRPCAEQWGGSPAMTFVPIHNSTPCQHRDLTFASPLTSERPSWHLTYGAPQLVRMIIVIPLGKSLVNCNHYNLNDNFNNLKAEFSLWIMNHIGCRRAKKIQVTKTNLRSVTDLDRSEEGTQKAHRPLLPLPMVLKGGDHFAHKEGNSEIAWHSL